jgi:dihydroorotate dehydrogenase electron transfer subunit
MADSMNATVTDRGIFTGRIAANVSLCRDHFRLTIHLPTFPEALPGQFVHLACHHRDEETDRALCIELNDAEGWPAVTDPAFRQPWGLIRRAFSIAGLRCSHDDVEIDVIHRVVGVGTDWLARLSPGEEISLIGPLGNEFAIRKEKPLAYMVAGGVGLPPMIWLAQALHDANKKSVAFCGAMTEDLLALDTRRAPDRVSQDATRPALSAAEFAAYQTPVLLSTDDGTLGVRGRVTETLSAYHAAAGHSPSDVVIYTCGPEPMLKAMADYAERLGIECQVCVERAMACGMGTCQSCVVRVHDPEATDGWRYRLCCTDGPVFDSRDLLW